MAVNFIRYDPVLFLYRPRMLDTLELHRNNSIKTATMTKKITNIVTAIVFVGPA